MRPLLRWLAAAVLLLALAALCLRDFYPPLPNPLSLTLELGEIQPGASEPLIVAGRIDAGDFLFVRYLDAHTLGFGYDSWAYPRLLSEKSVPIPADRRLRLHIEMPSLGNSRGNLTTPFTTRLRVECDGVTVLDATPHSFDRESAHIFFGEHNLDGTACGPTLHGRLLRDDGREIRGGARDFFSFRERFSGWLRYNRWQFAALLLLSAAVIRWGDRLAALRPSRIVPVLRSALSAHRKFFIVAFLSAAAFGWIVTEGTFHFRGREEFTCFYDFQAASLLQGHLDVPEDAIGREAFVVDGKLYGYFGLTPALLRLPFVIFDAAFLRLARSFMLLWFVGALAAAYLLLREAVKIIRGSAAVPATWTIVLFLGGAGLGSSLFFLGSRAYTYHEAILCGAAFALFTCWCALKHLAAPAGRWWLGALGCGLLALHARPPGGLFALTFLGCVALAIALRTRSLRRPFILAAGCALGVFSFNGMSYLKFKTFDGAPLRLSRPYDAARLANIDGKSFHASNLPFNFYTYLVRPNFHVEPRFPWLYLGSPEPGHYFPHAKIDLAEECLALPFAMPGLFALATLGGMWACMKSPAARLPLALGWAGVAPMTLAMFAAVATAHRYTGDFCPILIYGAAFGLAAIECATPRWRAACLALLGLATLWACLLTAAMTLHYQRDSVWGVPENIRQDYRQLRQRIDAFFGVPPQ